MKDVEAAIHAKVEEILAKNTLFAFLSDESLTATERLSRISPCLAYFVFGFYDLQQLVLKYPDAEAQSDRIKRAINAHCIEDSTHWPWFLTDLKTLNLDKETTYTSALKFLWGKTNQMQRWTCYQLAILADRASDPILRYAMLLSIEINGRAALLKLVEVAEKSEEETGKELFYFGRRHLARETGGLHGEEEVENELLEMDLDPETKASALSIAMKVLDIQNEGCNEMGRAAFANKKW